jgi:hypothetical protein
MSAHRPSFVATVLVTFLAGGCSTEGSPSPPPQYDSGAPVTSGAPGSFEERPPLPGDFPVVDTAVRMPLPPDDPGLIALWESGEAGSAAYDFYVAALPATGYPIVGLYPGGGVALIRFAVQGEIWQVAIHGAPDGWVAIEVRLDRP